MSNSAIRDNHSNGNVGDFLQQAITKNSDISIVSAYFTIYAYHRLKSNLDGINNLRFLFGEPTFIKSMDPDKTNVNDFNIEARYPDSKFSFYQTCTGEFAEKQFSMIKEMYKWLLLQMK